MSGSIEKILDWIAKKFCKRTKYSRAEVRKFWAKPQILEVSSESEEEEKEVEEEVDPEEATINAAALKLQRIVRGFLGKRRAMHRANDILQEVDAYWLDHYARLLDEERRQLILARERRDVAKQYIFDVVTVSTLYVLSLDDSSTLIQRIWRGFWVRKHRPKPRPPPKMRAKPRVVKGRLLPETLRRVWARSLFEPSDTSYLHKTDIGYKSYDMWTHANHPPKGNKHGLRTRKIPLPATENLDNVRLGKTIFAATDDRHAWLGIPIGLERFELKEQEKYLKSFQNMEKLLFAFPVSTKSSKINLRKSSRKIKKNYKLLSEETLDDMSASNMIEAEFCNPYAESLIPKYLSSKSLSKKYNEKNIFSLNAVTLIANNNSDSDSDHTKKDSVLLKAKEKKLKKRHQNSDNKRKKQKQYGNNDINNKSGLQSIPETSDSEEYISHSDKEEGKESETEKRETEHENENVKEEDYNRETEDDDTEDTLSLPDLTLTQRKIHFLKNLAEKHTLQLTKRLNAITRVVKGDKERGSKHWDELTGRYLQYLGDGRYRHLKTGKLTVESFADERKSSKLSSDNNIKISHAGRQNAEEALPINHYDTSFVNNSNDTKNKKNNDLKTKEELCQVILLPSTMTATHLGHTDDGINNNDLNNNGSSMINTTVSVSETDNNNNDNIHNNSYSSINGVPDTSVTIDSINNNKTPLLGRSQVSYKILKSGQLSVTDTLDREQRRSLAQQRLTEQHRQLFHRQFQIQSKLSSSATHQPPLTRHTPSVTLYINNASTTNNNNTASQWSRLKQDLQSRVSRHLTKQQQNNNTNNNNNFLSSFSTNNIQKEAKLAIVSDPQRQKRFHYRSVYTWLPQPLLASALKQHHYAHLSAKGSYFAQQQRVSLNRDMRVSRHTVTTQQKNDKYNNNDTKTNEDDNSSVSVSRDTVSGDTLSLMSLSVSQMTNNNNNNTSSTDKQDFLETESVLSLVSHRPPNRLLHTAIDANSSGNDINNGSNKNINGDNAKPMNKIIVAEGSIVSELPENTSITSSNNNTNNANSKRNLIMDYTVKDEKWKKQQWRAQIERDMFSETDDDVSHYYHTMNTVPNNNNSTNNNKNNTGDNGFSNSLDSTAALRPFPSFLHANPSPQSLPEGLVRRRHTATQGLAVSSHLTVNNLYDTSSSTILSPHKHNTNVNTNNNSNIVHRKFQERPSVMIPGPRDYLNTKRHMSMSVVSRDAKIAPFFDAISNTNASNNMKRSQQVLSPELKAITNNKNSNSVNNNYNNSNIRLGSALEQNSVNLESNSLKNKYKVSPVKPRPAQPPPPEDAPTLHPYAWL